MMKLHYCSSPISSCSICQNLIYSKTLKVKAKAKKDFILKRRSVKNVNINKKRSLFYKAIKEEDFKVLTFFFKSVAFRLTKR